MLRAAARAARPACTRRILRDGFPPDCAARWAALPADSLESIRRFVHTSLQTPGIRPCRPLRTFLICCAYALQALKCLPQFMESTVHLHFDRIHFAAEEPGYLFILKFLETAQHQDFPFLFRQVHQGTMQQSRFLVFLGNVRMRYCGRHLRLETCLVAAFAEVVNPGIAGDLINPRAKWRSRFVGMAVL